LPAIPVISISLLRLIAVTTQTFTIYVFFVLFQDWKQQWARSQVKETLLIGSK
jgi:hypothetical protein